MALYLDRDGVQECINKVGTQIENLQSAAREIDAIIAQQMGEFWQGDAYENCQATYHEEYEKMLKETVPGMVESLKGYIDQCNQKLQEADSALAGR